MIKVWCDVHGRGFLNIEKAFDTTWHPGLLYKLSELHFSPRLIKLINSFLSHRKFRVMVEGELSTPRNKQAEVPQGPVLSPIPPETLWVYLALFADDTCLYSTNREEGYVLRSLQSGLTAMKSQCERWNIKINEEKTQAISFSHRLTTVEASLTHSLHKPREIPRCNFRQESYMKTTHRNESPRHCAYILASTPS
jgi:hypothetical protein